MKYVGGFCLQKLINLVSRANKEFNLIEDGDYIAVAVSGGKDSLVLLEILCRMKTFFKIKFDLIAITVNLNFYNKFDDFSEVEKICEKYKVRYFVEKSTIADVVFNIRKEHSACSLCSKMRKGLINSIAEQQGCNKIALGHSLDDAVETFLMNLFSSGKLSCFLPKNYLSRKKLIQIRPLIFATEKEIELCATKLNLPVIKSRCYVDGKTNRAKVKQMLADEEKNFINLKQLIFGAIKRTYFTKNMNVLIDTL